MDINEIKKLLTANESVTINEDGEKVDAQRSKAAKKASKLKELKKELGLYEKYEEENDRKAELENKADACEDVGGASFSTCITGSQTATPVKVTVLTMNDIKEFING